MTLDRSTTRPIRSTSIPAATALALLVGLWLPGVSSAQSALYAVDGAGGGPSTLYRLDPSDGSVIQTIGPVGFDEVTGISFDPVTGVLYGTSSFSGGGSGDLITIDIETGAGTLVGFHGDATPDLSFAPSGILYAWVEFGSGIDDLITLDLALGTSTVVGDCGAGTFRTGLAIDEAGNAFMKAGDDVYAVDRVTGLCTFLTTLSPALSYHNILAFDDKGTLYTAFRFAGTTTLYTVDIATGTTTPVGSNGVATLSALAFQPPPLAPLYAADGSGSNPSTLYRLDPRNGSVLQTIGAIGFDHVTGLSFHPVTGVLYGNQSSGFGDDPGQLLTIDLTTGAGAAVGGPHGDTNPDIAFAPAGVLYAWTEASDDVATVDLTTGLTAVVGDCGFGTAGTGLAIDAAGNAVMKSSGALVYTVDRVTGACAPTVVPATPTLDNALSFSPRGTLYTLDRTGFSTDVYTLDLETGATRLVGSNGITNLAALAFQPPPLPPLYAADGSGVNPSTLYRLDPRDGSIVETIGPIGFSHVTGLAFHPVTGVLYGTESGGDLITIDLETGAGTSVGTHGVGTPDLSFAPSGILYTWNEPFLDDLTTLDTTTGAPTVVGDCGVSTGQTGLAVDQAGTAFVKPSGDLYTVDRASGVCTFVVAVPAILDNSLVFSPNGTPYSINRIGVGADLYTLDTETGATVLVGSNAIPNLAALAFKPAKPSNLYAVDGAGVNPSSLYLIDPDDASVVANLGPIGFAHVTGISFHPVTGALYGTEAGGDLITIDPETGAGASVGAHGVQTPDLSFAPSGVLYTWSEGLDDLTTLDLTTGLPTVVGDCGVGTASTGLAVDRQGNAFMKSLADLYSVDRDTGACTFLTLVVGYAGGGFGSNMLAFDPGGTLYTGERVAGTANLYTLDPSTGILTAVGSNDISDLAGLAFRPPPLAPFYATDGSSNNPSTLYRLDPRNASVLQTIGPIGFSHVTDLGFDPLTGTLYGVVSDFFGSGTAELLTIDVLTGAGTIVGGGTADQIPDISFAPGGTLFGWSELADELITIDLTTAATTGSGVSCNSAQTGFAIDQLFNAYMKWNTSLYSVDLGTGVCTFEVALAAPGTLHNILHINERGTMYTGSRSTAAGELFTADAETGAVMSVGVTGLANLSGVTFVPEPSFPLGLLAGVGALALLTRRRGVRR